jgi:hypothetical protein
VHQVVTHPTAPLLVGVLIGLFLLVQSRIDRDDPKLAAASDVAAPDRPDLRFGPPLRVR